MAEALQTARAALQQGLISDSDYEAVKAAFLRAQQIKAGLDAGFIQPQDYQQVKQAFLQALESLSLGGGVAQLHQPGQPLPPTHQQSFNGSNGPSQPPAAMQYRQDASSPPQASASGPAAAQALPPQQQAPMQAPRRSRVSIPTDIPKLGGMRPKQSQGTSMSGITVNEDAVNLYYFMKAKSNYRWAQWRINDAGHEVIIAAVGDKDSTLQEFVEELPQGDCRYGVYDYSFTNSEGFIFNKLVFLNWAPDSARIKAKMMYASTKDYFKGFLDGLSIELQGSEVEDFTEQDIADAVRSVVTRS